MNVGRKWERKTIANGANRKIIAKWGNKIIANEDMGLTKQENSKAQQMDVSGWNCNSLESFSTAWNREIKLIQCLKYLIEFMQLVETVKKIHRKLIKSEKEKEKWLLNPRNLRLGGNMVSHGQTPLTYESSSLWPGSDHLAF